jgi:hypothetical protein
MRAVTLPLAVAGLLVLAPAAAGAELTTLLSSGNGLSAPAGIARDNGGHLWVADEDKGVCRVDPAVERLIEDGIWCTREEHEEDDDHAPAPPPVRPKEAGQIAYDPLTSQLFVAEGTSSSSGVWRMDVDAVAGRITAAQKIYTDADRVFALALGDDAGTPVLDFGLKRTPVIKRLTNPATCTAPCGATSSGSALAEEPLGLAFLGGELFVAEDTGVTRIANAGVLGEVARPVGAFAGGVPSAVAADPVNGRIYAGTDNGNNVDQVDVLNLATGGVETYAIGLVGVTALGVATGGELLIGEDPHLGAEQTGNGRIHSAPLTALSRPTAEITDGPPLFTNGRSVTFRLAGPPGTALRCRQDPDELTPWAPCGTGSEGSASFGSLDEGLHVLEVRAVSPDPATGAGPVQRRTFVVDRTEPSVTIDNPGSDREVVGGAVTFRFSSSDPTAAFACAVDGGAPATCSDPRHYDRLAPGEHRFAVTATDAAGNASAPATWTFSVRAPRASAPPAAPPAAIGPAPVVAPPPTFAQPSRVNRGLRLSVALRPGRVKLLTNRRTRRGLRRTRRLVSSVVAPRTARWAVVGLWRTKRRTVRRGRPPLALAAVRLVRTGRSRVRLVLTARQAKRLRRGSYLVGLVLTDGADRIGPGRYRRLKVVR